MYSLREVETDITCGVAGLGCGAASKPRAERGDVAERARAERGRCCAIDWGVVLRLRRCGCGPRTMRRRLARRILRRHFRASLSNQRRILWGRMCCRTLHRRRRLGASSVAASGLESLSGGRGRRRGVHPLRGRCCSLQRLRRCCLWVLSGRQRLLGILFEKASALFQASATGT